MKNVTLYLAIAMLAAACASNDKKADGPAVTDRSTATAPAQPTTGSRPTQTAPIAGDPLKDPNNILSKRSVYFEYDSNSVKESDRNLVQAHARYMGDKSPM